MILLSQLRDPERRDFSDLFGAPPGTVWLTLKRLESPDFALAKQRTLEAIFSARKGRTALAAYGFDKPDETGAYLDATDADTMTGIGLIIGAVEIGMLAVAGIEGIQQEVERDGRVVVEPAEVSRANLAMLMRQESVRERFMRAVEELERILVIEKKGFGPSPPGSSQAEETSDPNIVSDAETPTPPAAATSAAPEENFARR